MEILNFVSNIFLEQSEFWWLAFLFLFGWVWTVWGDNVDTAAAANINALQNCKVDTDEVPILQNILGNSQFGAWSQSDANKGLASVTVDSGSTRPTPGETVTGATSGATGKAIWMDNDGGNWGAGTGTGDIKLGATTGCFNDNENLDGTVSGANFATVNHPVAAIGADQRIRNGAFVPIADDPPTSWNAGASATLTTEAGGQVGNCMMITEGGEANPYTYQDFVVESGKIYKFSFYVKQGTEATYRYYVYDRTNPAWIYQSSDTEAGAGWVQQNVTFETPVGCVLARIYFYQICAAFAATNIYFDEITVYEITPCCTGADTVAFDGWVKQNTFDIYRQHNDATYTKDGSFYSLKLVTTEAITDHYVRFPGANSDNEEWYMQFRGRVVMFGAWVYASKSNHCRLRIIDSVGNNQTDWHPGDGAWHWLEVTRLVDAAATSLYFYITAEGMREIDGDSIIYVSQPMVAFGQEILNIIGEGNYKPGYQEWIYTDAYIPSNKYDNTTGWGDVAWTDLNLEADSDAMLPKGAKVIKVHMKALDSGSGALVDVHIHLRKSVTAGEDFCACWGGRTNSVEVHKTGMQPCNADGDVEVELEASGGATLDIVEFRYLGVQVT